ncbi:HXXEE domain-containing protein [Thermopolyspora sp. NPDC052614]|uniref:HXXEE domain-containing protein n=1 Tax=Thermopolyspora sp. NPDC052614 TaxID=3155682 RepID=UPI003426B15F
MTVRKAATWGLLAAWAVHETEEAVVMARWLRANLPKLRERFPKVPDSTWERLERDMTPARVRLAIGLMGVLMAAASADGARTGGRSFLYRTALAAYGWHGVIHLAQTAAYRGYTPGAATAPVVVVPFAVWAWRQLRKSGIDGELGRTSAAALVLFTGGLAASHAIAARVLGQHGAGGRPPGEDAPRPT